VVAIVPKQGNEVALRWLLYDGHGNWVRTMLPDYTLSGFQWRGVWGEVQSLLGVGRGYCANLGHPEDETGLVYMRARYYEPATGRFLSEDPARHGVNWYLYADGNPVNKVDSTGRYADWVELMKMFHAIIDAAWDYIRRGDKVGLEHQIRIIERMADNKMRQGQADFETAVLYRALAEAFYRAGGSFNADAVIFEIEAGNYARRAAKRIATAWNLRMLAQFLRVMMDFSLN